MNRPETTTLKLIFFKFAFIRRLFPQSQYRGERESAVRRLLLFDGGLRRQAKQFKNASKRSLLPGQLKGSSQSWRKRNDYLEKERNWARVMQRLWRKRLSSSSRPSTDGLKPRV